MLFQICFRPPSQQPDVGSNLFVGREVGGGGRHLGGRRERRRLGNTVSWKDYNIRIESLKFDGKVRRIEVIVEIG